jgi:NADPH-dependent 2,4-dienoyl-CoA reductase/sulfur reductase-like enzyme
MKLLVVGGVAAGLSAASRARRLDARLEITVLEKGTRISYGACGLPYWIEGQVRSLDQLTVHTPEFFERERDIRVRTGCEVVRVQHGRREVALSSGERIGYDRLIWAAGARPALTACSERVFPFHTDLDAARLQRFIEERGPRTAAVVGGGSIGLEMAGALRARGLHVTLYEQGTTLMQREDAWLSKVVSQRLEQCGVEVFLNTRVDSFDGLMQDFVLVCAGLRPNVGPLEEAGAELGRTGALRVDERQETSLGGVYAAGDCCEAMHLVSRRPIWLPLGTTANKAGRVAGSNAAGARERFEGIVGTSVVRVAGLGVAATGFSAQQARREGFSPVEVVIEDRARPKYFFGKKVAIQLVADRGTRRLLGAAIAGDEDVVGRINVVATALQGRMKVEDLCDLDLAYAPPYAVVTDPLLTAARQLQKVLG